MSTNDEREGIYTERDIEAAAKAHCDFFGGEGWWDTGLIADTKPKALEAMRAALAFLPAPQPPAPGGDAVLATKLRELQAARQTFVTARQRMNEARPPVSATPAERALYDERYKADHEAERELHRVQSEFAMWATEVDAADLANHSPDTGEGAA